MFFMDIQLLTTRLTVSTLGNTTLESTHKYWQVIFGNYVVHKNKKILDFFDTRGFKKKLRNNTKNTVVE